MAKPTLNPTSAQQKAVLKLLEDGSRKDEKTDKKQSVLESHGYTLGRTIGSGSFATVKVGYYMYVFDFHIDRLTSQHVNRSRSQVGITAK